MSEKMQEQIHIVGALKELRFEVKEKSNVILMLKKGTAEVFGVPLVINRSYQMSPGNYAVFSWYSGEVSISTTENNINNLNSYISDDTCMISTVNLHGVIDAERAKSVQNNKTGPRIVICGPTDSGKSTLSKILLAYAARRDRRPIFVDVDLGQGEVTIPGMLAAATVDLKSLSVEEGITFSNPISFFHGETSQVNHPELFKRLLDNLIIAVEKRMIIDQVANSSGMIINTCGWIDGLGYQLLLYTIKAVKADAVVVLGHDRLLNDLRRDVGLKSTDLTSSSSSSSSSASSNNNENSNNSNNWLGARAILKIQRSAGVVERQKNIRSNARDRRLKEYFYGSHRLGELSPSLIDIPFSSVTVVKYMNESAAADKSLRPVTGEDDDEELDPVLLQEVTITPHLINHILALSYAEKEDDVSKKNVAGIIYVKEVNLSLETMKVLSPMPGPLPGKFLILGGIKVLDL